VQVVADMSGTVALERLLPAGYPLVGPLASAGGHPRLPSVIHPTTVVAGIGRALIRPSYNQRCTFACTARCSARGGFNSSVDVPVVAMRFAEDTTNREDLRCDSSLARSPPVARPTVGAGPSWPR
jgi:hypothetical protein